MTEPKIVILVAGGKGKRMQTDIPKQFIEVNGKPILMYTMEVFYRYCASVQLILVLPSDQIEYWKELCKKHSFNLVHKIIVGGRTRHYSVKNGLEVIKIPSLVAIHDGVRPLVSLETISRCFKEAEKHGTAIPVMDMEESIRKVSENDSQSVDRSAYKIVQTPQVFRSEILKKAYEQNISPLFTDDASVVEASGIKINLVAGNRENIKITTSFDLELAEAIIKARTSKA